MKKLRLRKMDRCIIILCLLFFLQKTNAQELNAKVTVVSSQISTTSDKHIFVTLEKQLSDLLNNRKWTSDNFKSNERIECTFLLTLSREIDKNIYGATLQIQAARPIYNSTYNSPLINYKDQDIAFKYIENQPVEFNENRVRGNDPEASNLTAIFGYYVNLILGMDYESFSMGAGEPYFKKMLNIVNNAPDGSSIKGWTQFDGQTNRYWLSENLMNSRYTQMKEVFYGYYRLSLDNWYDNEQQAREGMIGVLNTLNIFATDNPTAMILRFFMIGKSDELINMFNKSNPDQKNRVLDILQKVDPTNATKYKDALK